MKQQQAKKNLRQNMKLILMIFFIVFNSCGSKAQNDTINKSYKDAEDLKSQIDKYEIETLIRVDSTFGYKTEVPEWLYLTETGNDKVWGGTFPSIGGIENAMMIKGFDTSEFKSFEHFTEIYITGNKFGKKTLYSENHNWYGHNPRDLHNINNGVSCRVFTFFQNKIYHNQFALIETKKAFLWVQFVATPDTFELNLPKFTKFVQGIELVE
jgi:hypothetical protein